MFCSLLVFSGCKDDDDADLEISPRKVRFELYTDQDFSSETDSIIFEPRIVGDTVLWDSAFTLHVKDIPAATDKIVFEKVVPNDDNSELKVGFRYTIIGVGISWYNQKLSPGEQFKTVSFNFN